MKPTDKVPFVADPSSYLNTEHGTASTPRKLPNPQAHRFRPPWGRRGSHTSPRAAQNGNHISKPVLLH